MPTYVDPNACNACAGIHEGPLCVYICPNDLMILDPKSNKGFNQEPELCSECYACVKLCPPNAIHVRGYADFVPLGAEVQPHYEGSDIVWNVRFRDGRKEHFRFASRTTPKGSINPFKGVPEADMGQLRSQALFGEPEYLQVSKVPTPNGKVG
jgi:adenylylsulfate reductase, subunit B